MASISLTFSDADDGQAGERSERVDAKRLLAVIAQDRHAERNRAVFMLSLLAGFRACEVAGLMISCAALGYWRGGRNHRRPC